MSDWVLATEQAGFTRHFDASALPVSFGSSSSDDLVLADVHGSVQIGMLDQVFFVQPSRETRNVRVDDELLQGSRRLDDGSVIAFDTARLICRIRDGRLTLRIEARLTAGDTAPPDFDALAQNESSELKISPIAFKPSLEAQQERKQRFRKTTIAIYAAFVVLGSLGWFAFTAKSIEFELTPAADAFDLPETLWKFRLGERYLLREGSHRIVAEREGYYPIDETIDVGVLPDQTFEFEFVRLPGLVTFRTEPEAQAEVSIDGQVVGTTPLVDFEVRPGTHQIEFVAERYLTEVASIDVEGGHERDTVTVALTPSWAPVSVTSEPAGADVLVDGRALAVTPATLELTAGERDIELSLPGYNSWQREIRVFADEPQELETVVLSLADARVELITEPDNATVTVNGQYRGHSPVNLTLTPNVEHQVRVDRQGYQSVTRNLTLAPDGRRQLDIDLEPELGVVSVRTDPPEAEVLVNGEPAGRTPLELDLMTIEQDIAIRLDGYAGVEETITPIEGYPQTLDYDLVLLDAVTGDGYAKVITTGQGQRLRLVLPGRFQMGSSRGDPDARLNEVLRQVELTRAFYLAEREMTNAEFRQCDPDHDSGVFEGLSLNDDDQPVVNVTIEEVFRCLNQLSIEDGLQPVYVEEGDTLVPQRPLRNGYRLATEAEFAWALRGAGAGLNRYSWGDDTQLPDRFLNIADQSAEEILPNVLVTYVDGYPVSAPVGSFAPNAAGLYDIDGNVDEWVQDFYDPLNRGGAPILTDPLGPETGRSRVVRGASWRSYDRTQLRLSYRDYENEAREDLGFRIARNLE